MRSSNTWTTRSGTTVDRILGGRSNVFLLSRNNRSILVDTGTQMNWSILRRRLDALPVAREALRALILTHVHYDHAANAARIRAKYNAKIIVHESEAALLESGINAQIQGAMPATQLFFKLSGGSYFFERLRFQPSDYDVVVNDKFNLHDFGFDAYIIPTPGHTSGSMSVIVDDEIAVVGDALFGVFPHSVFPPWAEDTAMMVKSWKILLDTGCSLFLPSHGRQRDRKLLLTQYAKYTA